MPSSRTIITVIMIHSSPFQCRVSDDVNPTIRRLDASSPLFRTFLVVSPAARTKKIRYHQVGIMARSVSPCGGGGAAGAVAVLFSWRGPFRGGCETNIPKTFRLPIRELKVCRGKQTIKDQEDGCAPITPSCLVIIDGFRSQENQSPDGRQDCLKPTSVVVFCGKTFGVTGIMPGERGSSEVGAQRGRKRNIPRSRWRRKASHLAVGWKELPLCDIW
ncbi:hypothetical protein B0T20DRAFT_399016 [Sordaria brevicollis]|uniref:Uncharacterized protein n=1 Tax=Sordaria brevicollis TaxID=83679 RepID=A0AAE0PMS2_SORBR|nr:hypothetical protein B0T20DRAFT_399016 [Sordaria brevicollis]